jgi:hypothetical protein
MVKWRLPSSAPRDGSSFAVKKSNGVFENCFFDQDEAGFVLTNFVDAKKRLAPTLTDHIGWVPWQVLFEHIHDTGDVLDRQELNETLLFADHTTITLKRLAKLSSAEDRKPFDSAISAIESLRKLLPKGDWF